jgi:hypothetical protein
VSTLDELVTLAGEMLAEARCERDEARAALAESRALLERASAAMAVVVHVASRDPIIRDVGATGTAHRWARRCEWCGLGEGSHAPDCTWTKARELSAGKRLNDV